jgi:NADPH:quinone reductase-like Zn-dependent oxidoreductase
VATESAEARFGSHAPLTRHIIRRAWVFGGLISGPPDPSFAKEAKLNWLLRQLLGFLSAGIRRKAQRKQVSYSFPFMRASGEQLQRISLLVESGALRPVIDKVYSLVAAKDALAYVDTGRSKGKVVIKVFEP